MERTNLKADMTTDTTADMPTDIAADYGDLTAIWRRLCRVFTPQFAVMSGFLSGVLSAVMSGSMSAVKSVEVSPKDRSDLQFLPIRRKTDSSGHGRGTHARQRW